MSPHAFGWSSFGESTTDEDDDEVEGSDQDAVVVGRNTVRGATEKMSDLAYKFEVLARKCEPKPWYRLLADDPDRPKTLYWLEKRVVCLEEQLNEAGLQPLEDMTEKHRKALRRVSSLDDALREYQERDRMAEEDLTSRRLEDRIAIRALSLENDQLRVHRSELEESLEECRGLVREMEEEAQRRVQMMDDERSEWRTREEQLNEKLRETADGLARVRAR
ncbi:hypothetical protein FOZ62_031604 [Perkinsus olseni]|uniref:Uncharacterized protein n=1 Tax=Perkinsus olseni TaxID=32597 RepID=A0A7J6PT08_PEROL|nr:hypothetical protein FOZ62_031604 [Perkinsus olseni]